MSLGARLHEDPYSPYTGDLSCVEFVCAVVVCHSDCTEVLTVTVRARTDLKTVLWSVLMACGRPQVACLALQIRHAHSQVAAWIEYDLVSGTLSSCHVKLSRI